MKRSLAFLLTIALIISLFPIGFVFADTAAKINVNGQAVSGDIYKLVVSASVPNGVKGASITISYDSLAVTPVKKMIIM